MGRDHKYLEENGQEVSAILVKDKEGLNRHVIMRKERICLVLGH